MAIPMVGVATWISRTIWTYLFAYGLSWIVKTLLGLGVGFVTFKGGSAVLDVAKQQIIDKFSGIPADVLAIISLSKIDVGITIYFSLIAGGLAIKATTAVMSMRSTRTGTFEA